MCFTVQLSRNLAASLEASLFIIPSGIAHVNNFFDFSESFFRPIFSNHFSVISECLSSVFPNDLFTLRKQIIFSLCKACRSALPVGNLYQRSEHTPPGTMLFLSVHWIFPKQKLLLSLFRFSPLESYSRLKNFRQRQAVQTVASRRSHN